VVDYAAKAGPARQAALGSTIITKILGEITPVDLSSIAGDVPGLLAWDNVSAIRYSEGTNITIFFSNKRNTDGSLPVGVAFGASASASSGANPTSNWALGLSYYWQLEPSQSVPFR
jgi:hypothetical protein